MKLLAQNNQLHMLYIDVIFWITHPSNNTTQDKNSVVSKLVIFMGTKTGIIMLYLWE